MDSRLMKLPDDLAVQALRNVARKWIQHRGIEAFIVVDTLRRQYGNGYNRLPSWLDETPAGASKQLAEVSKLCLDAILDGDDSQPRAWVEEELADLGQARAQVLDPLSLAIIGATIIGIILASRVKKLGDVEFYEGVPKETVEIVKAATSISVPKP